MAGLRLTEALAFYCYSLFLFLCAHLCVLAKIFGCVISHKIFQHFCQVPGLGCSVKNNSNIYTFIEKDHLGDRSPEKDCC